MLCMLFTAPLFLLIDGIIAIIPPATYAFTGGLTDLISMLSIAFQFFPVDVWISVFASIVFWVTIQLSYGVVNFILRLIPILGMGQ